MTNYLRLALALVQGDKQKANIIRNEKLSKSALKGQLAALDGMKINQEMKVEKCEEEVKNAILNIQGEEVHLIASSESWIDNVRRAKNALKKAKEDLEDIETSIQDWTDLSNGEYYQEAAGE